MASLLSPSRAARAPFPAGPEPRIAEEDLSRIWYEGGFASRGLRTRCGRRVRILYRGLPNGERGPDYRGAVLSLGRGKPRPGDIELHVRASQWRAHGHHLDPNYDGVILHVVWQDDESTPTTLHNGRAAPVLALREAAVRRTGGGFPGEPCLPLHSPDPTSVGLALDRAGEDRFLGKASRLEGDMAVFPAGEVLFQSLAEALGYSRNKAPFRRLASALPLASLEGLVWGKRPEHRLAHAEALLLGTAGLLPSQRDRPALEKWPVFLERAWASYGMGPQLRDSDWYLGIRPENHPVRRIAALAALVVSTLDEGLISWALNRVGSRVQGPGFREDSRLHSAPCTPHPIPFVGRDRSLEITANVLLPFAYSHGQATSDEGLSMAALERYASLPAPASNQITRHMTRQLLGPGGVAVVRTARRQQGLLHLFHSYCTMGRCTECGIWRRHVPDKP